MDKELKNKLFCQVSEWESCSFALEELCNLLSIFDRLYTGVSNFLKDSKSTPCMLAASELEEAYSLLNVIMLRTAGTAKEAHATVTTAYACLKE